MADVTSRIIGVESGGNPYARNPRSSAGGAGQFIDSTWLNTLKRHRPDLAAGKSDAELLRMKFDPTLSREMTSAYASDNQSFLKSKGIDPTPGNTYLAHFAGPSGAAALYANPLASVEATLGPRVVAANPFLRGKTGQDVIDWAAGKMDPGKAMAANLRQRFAAGPKTEGGVTQPEGVDRLKSALGGKSYDPDRITAGQDLQKRAMSIATSGDRTGAIGGTILSGLGGLLEGYEGVQKKEHDEALTNALMNSGGAKDTIGALVSSSDPEYRKAGIEMLLKSQTAKPVTDEWVSAGEGYVMNKANGEVRPIEGFRKESKPVEVGGQLVQQQPDGSYKEVYTAPQKARNLTVNEQKEVFEADEGVQASNNVIGALNSAIELNKKAYSGPAAQTRGYIGSLFGAEGGAATEELQNVVLQQVLDNLKATFGATPTEGERQILIDVQGSVNKAPEVREKIFKNAIGAAERRKAFNEKKASAIRGGEYFQPGFSPTYKPSADVPTPVKTQTIDPMTGQASTAEPQAPISVPPAAVDKLMSNPTPEMRSFFDQKYGAGAADRELAKRQKPAPTPQDEPQYLGSPL